MEIAFPHPPGGGGPGSFQSRFETALKDRNWRVHYAETDYNRSSDLIFVVGGTRKLYWLYRQKKRKTPIVYRLDGLLWQHRAANSNFGVTRWLGSEARNAMAQWVHGMMADTVVYQSEFVRNWWARDAWRKAKHYAVIPNGIDLTEFQPVSKTLHSKCDVPDVVCVEGTIDYSTYAVELMNVLAEKLGDFGAKIVLYGAFERPSNERGLHPNVDYRGVISRAEVCRVFRGRVYLSLDVNPACPNTVAEALASGAPVIGFDTGAVKELVGDEGGCIVPFGGDPWKGQRPDFPALLGAYKEVVGDFDGYSCAARRRAEERYSIDKMVDAYIGVIQRAVARCRA